MKQDYWIIAGAIVVIALLFITKTPKKIMSKLSRGYRNRNPGNIRLTSKFWQGEIKGDDEAFKTFKSMEWGYRAIFVLLRTYISKGVNTIGTIINRYAPPNENNTGSYAMHVAERSGIDINEPVSSSDRETMIKIVKEISRIENGVQPDMSQIEGGYKLYAG
jgi:hypothetical protein